MRSHRSAAGLIPAAALIVALASCSPGITDSGEQQASAASPTPTVSASVTDAPTSEAMEEAREPSCAPTDIDVSLGESPDDNATGERSLAMRFINNGAGVCLLQSRPAVDFLDDGGNSIGLREDDKQYVHSGYTIPFHLHPGSSADVIIAKYRCDLGDKAVATRLKLGLPGAGETTTLIIDPDLRQIASCLGGADEPGQTFAVSGYKEFTCHLVGNATGGGWCDGDLGRQSAQTPDEAATAARKAELARRR